MHSENLEYIQNKELKDMMACGLNHIPLRQTCISETIEELLRAWVMIASIIQLSEMETTAEHIWLSEFFWKELKLATTKNLGGFKASSSRNLNTRALAELRYLTGNFYVSGVDKASKNISIICITHVREMALKRLQEEDFEPHLKTMADILYRIRVDLDRLLLEIRFKYTGPPYLFATYKLHKQKYRWITSATRCTFSGVASIITQVLKVILQELRIWCGNQAKKIFNLY